MHRRLLAIICFLALPLLGLGTATPASAQTPLTAEVTSATLVAKGAAVDVDLTVTCEAGQTGGAFIRITQRSSNTITQGSGIAEPRFVCTGEPQIVTVRVIADPGGRPFKVGDAVAEIQVSACNEFGSCQFIQFTDTVHIRR